MWLKQKTIRFWAALLATISFATLGLGGCALPFFNTSSSESGMQGEASQDESPELSEESSWESGEDTRQKSVTVSKKKYVLVANEGNNAPVRCEKLDAKGYLDGEFDPDATFEYVYDTNYLSIEEDGTMIPKLTGVKTFVTVWYGDASVRVEVFLTKLLTNGESGNEMLSYVQTYGRTYTKPRVEGGVSLYADHIGSGVEILFYGTSLKADLSRNGNGYLCVFVDDETEYSKRFLVDGDKEYTVIDGLEEGWHTVKILKSSEYCDSQIIVEGFYADQFAAMPKKSEILVEFVGDSITTGFGSLGVSGDEWSLENSDGCLAYAFRAAMELDVDFSIIAKRGICVKANSDQPMNDVYKMISPYNPEAYEFAKPADVVVVNLGTNDADYVTSNLTYASVLPDDYYEFLSYVREKNPNAYVICIYGMIRKAPLVTDALTSAIERLNDPKIYYMDEFTPSDSGVEGHPSTAMQKRWGKDLAAEIRGLLGLEG
ncbi:MAG: hypothetical protein IJV85_05970 [Clostridia bacterium]|nr:hypothetical protein [Clostridia bacterium]